jgi:hypothetical protein
MNSTLVKLLLTGFLTRHNSHIYKHHDKLGHNQIAYCQNEAKSLMKHFKGFGCGFTELHAKLGADMLLSFAIHCGKNET